MDEFEEKPEKKGRKRLIVKISRPLVQFFFFLLFGNLAWIGISFFMGSFSRGFPLPVMQSHATPGGTIAGVYDVFMESFSHGIFPFLGIGVFLVFAILIGRGTCGWMCPFGFVQDLCHYVPVRKRVPGYVINRQLSKVKYVILFLTFFLAVVIGLVRLSGGTPLPLGPFTDNPFSPLNPATTAQAVIPLFIITPGAFPSVEEGFWALFSDNPWFWFQVIFLIIFLILCMYIGRAWCRWFCPLGAMLGIMTPYAVIGVQRNLSKCLGKKCRECELACPMGVPLLREPWEKITDSNCIMCMKCYEACDEGAITLNFLTFKQS